jgi:hypothetical protein
VCRYVTLVINFSQLWALYCLAGVSGVLRRLAGEASVALRRPSLLCSSVLVCRRCCIRLMFRPIRRPQFYLQLHKEMEGLRPLGKFGTGA